MPAKKAKTKTTDSDINIVRAPEETPAPETVNRGEVIEIEWENVKHIFEFRQRLQEVEDYFANMCLQFEKSKANLMSQITFGQTDLYSMAEELQKAQNIDSNLTYELKLPSTEGEKAYFLRKDD